MAAIYRDQDSNLDLWFRKPLCSIHYTIAVWSPDQGLNLDTSGRSRAHCPLCYQGVGEPGRDRTDDDLGCSQAPFLLGYGLMAGHRGIEPRSQPGLEPSALTQSVPLAAQLLLRVFTRTGNRTPAR